MISKKLALDVLNESLKSGAEFAELYIQNKYVHAISLSFRRVDSISSKLIYGCGLRLIKGDSQVYGYTSDLSRNSLMKLASSLSASFDGERIKEVKELRIVPNPKHHRPLKGHDSLSTEDKISCLKKAEKAMYDYSPLIMNASVSLLENDEDVFIYNSKGRLVKDNRVRTRLAVGAVASKDGQFETAFEGPGASKGLEFLDEIDIVELATECAKTACDLLDAPECPSGKMPVIIGNKFGGVLFHEACGHPLEATAISHNASVFAGKLGQKIASDVVTAIDDGTIENAWGSSNFDDEGNKTTKNVLIKNGVLVNYMVDDYDGKRLNLSSTGACRRESYKYKPVTRMTNTFIANGKSTKEEIIKATKYGLYCESFNGGSVDPATDKFNFTASKAYIVKDGKIDHLVRAASLVGYGYEILPKIDMVANDCARGEGMCGAASGSVPADVGQPTLRVSEMTVGGRGGN